MFRVLWWRRVVPDSCAYGPGRLFLWPLHGATCKDEGFVPHVRGGECFAGQVRDPVPELIMTCRDKAASLTIGAWKIENLALQLSQ